MTLARRITGLARGGAAFSPDDVSGLVAWYDFADASTMFTDAGSTNVASDGDTIYQINDKSVSGFDLTQTDSGQRPTYKVAILNGHSVGRSSGAHVLFNSGTSAQSQPNTIFVVGNNTYTSGSNSMFFDGSSGRNTIYRRGSDGFWATYAGSAEQSSVASDTSTHIHAVVFDGSSTKMRLDGGSATTTSPGTNDLTGIYVFSASGGGVAIIGDIGEVLVYHAGLSNGDLDLVGEYLADKWGLTWTPVS